VGYGKGFTISSSGAVQQPLRLAFFFEAEELITDSYKDDIQVDYCITQIIFINSNNNT
jgi:hypothetical protein